MNAVHQVVSDRWCVLGPLIHSTPSEQNGRHSADDKLKRIFVNKKFYILIKNSLKFVSNGQINNNPVLV